MREAMQAKDTAVPEGRVQRDWRRLAKGAFSLALVAAIFAGVLPKLADFSEVWTTIGKMTWLEISTLALVALWNLVSYWIVVMAVLPGLSLRRAATVNLTGGAIANAVPGGGAVAVGVTYAMLSSWGFPNAAIALSVLVSGIWNTFLKLGLPVIALALLVTQQSASSSLVIGAGVGVGILMAGVGTYALMLRSAEMARRVGARTGAVVSALRRWVRRPPVSGWDTAAVRFRTDTIELLRTRWLVITLAQLLSHLALYLVLLLALRHVGVSDAEVGWAAVLAAFAFVRLLSALPITPGGLGVVELGLVAALALAGGDREQVVAAVFVYRALTFLPAIPLGTLTYVAWRRSANGRPRHQTTDNPVATAAALASQAQR